MEEQPNVPKSASAFPTTKKCGMCLELKPGEEMAKLSCKHLFCTACITQLAASDPTATCPFMTESDHTSELVRCESPLP